MRACEHPAAATAAAAASKTSKALAVQLSMRTLVPDTLVRQTSGARAEAPSTMQGERLRPLLLVRSPGPAGREGFGSTASQFTETISHIFTMPRI